MKEKVKEWLQKGKIDVFLGYKMVRGHPLPFCFNRENLGDLDDLITGGARYPLEKVAARMVEESPDIKIGILSRDCNHRALNVLYTWNQLRPETIETLDVTCCPSLLKKHADCSYLEATNTGGLKKRIGIDNGLDTDDVEAYEPDDRFARWMYEFQKCIKCYGCRNICPVCFCKECSLENSDLIKTGSSPPEAPIFHLARAVHMAGRCIDCGLCEDACPVGIPLRLLYKKVNEIVTEVFHYETGAVIEQSPFNALGDQIMINPEPIEAA